MTDYQLENGKREMASTTALSPRVSRAGAFPQFAPASHLRSSQHNRFPAAVMHDFARMSVHVPGQRTELADDSACASGKAGKNGGTGCDASTGKTFSNIYDPPACYRHCVVRHEAKHAADIAPCCTRANVAHKAAKSDDAKQAVQDKFDQWMLSNQDWLECRAYTESARCGQEYMEKNCGGKKQDAGTSESATAPEAEPTVSLEPLGTRRTAPTGNQSQDVTPANNTMLAEDKPDGGPGGKPDAGTEPPGPEKCCPQLRCYWRVSQGRADTVCQDAPKTLGKCPF